MSYIDLLIDGITNTRIVMRDGFDHLYKDEIDQIIKIFEKKKENRCKVYFCGNGGSAGIAIHMTADYLKNGGFRTCSLYEPAMLTCLGNDYDYSQVFSKQLELLIDEGDLLVAISSSGNSKNIIESIKIAHERGAEVLTLTGFKDNNAVKQMGDWNIYVPVEKYGIVESIHQIILQQIVDEIME